MQVIANDADLQIVRIKNAFDPDADLCDTAGILTYPHLSSRILTYPHVCSRMLTYAYLRMLT
jgi:hypothetical protein